MKKPKEQIDAAVARAAEILRITEITREAHVFLFDEPLSRCGAADADARGTGHADKRLDATMIYLTHDQVEAMTMADRIVVLRSGAIEQVGAPLDLYRDPVNTFLLGVPHRPEHVDESYWDCDAQRMAAAGFNSVRMEKFAWHIWEPYRGHFDFDLFDRAIEGLAKHGIKTILCTPTATPPRWLTEVHPEILRVDMNGRVASHGSRKHADTTSPVFRDHSCRITKAIAEHYRNNPQVIGWQTDNELNTTTSLSFFDSCEIEFRKWCHFRYGTIDKLNEA